MKNDSYLLANPLFGGMHWIPIPVYAVALTASRGDFGKSFKSNKHIQTYKNKKIKTVVKILLVIMYLHVIYIIIKHRGSTTVLKVGGQILKRSDQKIFLTTIFWPVEETKYCLES